LNHSDRELEAALRASRGDEGIALVSQMAEFAKSRDQPNAPRAATLLRVAGAPLLYRMWRGADPLSSARASVALGARGDTAALRPALELARIKEVQWLRKVYPYESFSVAALEYLAEHPVAAESIPQPLTQLEETPIPTLGALVRVLAKTGRDETIRSVVDAFARHPDADPMFGIGSEDRSVGAAIPSRMNRWVLARALAEPDPVKQAKLGSLYKEMIRSQRGDDCSTFLGFGTLSEFAAACAPPK
jgi:hypothetical protein